MQTGTIVSKQGLENSGWTFLRHYSSTTEIWFKDYLRIMYIAKERLVSKVYNVFEENYSTGGWV